MHTEVKTFVTQVKNLFPDYFTDKWVWEIGSLNVNGSVRDYFTDCNYTGIDLIPGEGVDKVAHARTWTFTNYDVVISTEALEHDQYWDETLRTMYRALMPGGLMIFTCAGPEREEHGTNRSKPEDSPATNDYYGNISIEMIQDVFDLEKQFSEHVIQYERGEQDLMFCGVKSTRYTEVF